MSKKFFVAWCIFYLIFMALLIIFGGIITSWLDLFTGFVLGWTFYAMLLHFKGDDRPKRNLK